LSKFKIGDMVRIKMGQPGLSAYVNEIAEVIDFYPENAIEIKTTEGFGLYVPATSIELLKESTSDKYETGVKFDNGKPSISLAPSEAILGMCDAFGYGAKKYERNNYRKGYEWTRALDAAVRHILSELDGEEKDEESGLSHWKHALACIAMYAYFKTNNVGTDDRYKKG
jgi:hypothetical protein